MPPNPPSSMSLRDMQILKTEKEYSWPALPNPGDAPDIY